MNQNDRIYIAGHRGMVGSAITRALEMKGYRHLIGRSHDELDLMDQRAVEAFFQSEQPDYVFLSAGKVGGILANASYPANFIYENLAIEKNVIHAAWKFGIKRLLFLGSSCIYPRDCAQPIKESYLMDGPLEKTNRPYAIAKIAGIEMCWSYNRQYSTRYLSVMPTNLYGLGDHYDPVNSHVIPAMIYKFHKAKVENASSVTVWGSGNPRREFLNCDDAADACVFLMNLPDSEYISILTTDFPPIVNVGCGEDFSIREIATQIAEVVGYGGNVVWDISKPDGTPRKLLDISRLKKMGWSSRISLRVGLEATYQDFVLNCEKNTIRC